LRWRDFYKHTSLRVGRVLDAAALARTTSVAGWLAARRIRGAVESSGQRVRKCSRLSQRGSKRTMALAAVSTTRISSTASGGIFIRGHERLDKRLSLILATERAPRETMTVPVGACKFPSHALSARRGGVRPWAKPGNDLAPLWRSSMEASTSLQSGTSVFFRRPGDGNPWVI
jgi:hypothetical protein